jgi:1,4-alpha-glucan branching enzyme
MIAALGLALGLPAVTGGCQPPALARSPEIAPEGVVFRYRAPAARIVQLAGSWDGNSNLAGQEWTRDTRVARMEDADHDGTWELQVPLGPGRYEYVFVVDGRFTEADPANPQRIPDGSGGSRSLLVVP